MDDFEELAKILDNLDSEDFNMSHPHYCIGGHFKNFLNKKYNLNMSSLRYGLIPYLVEKYDYNENVWERFFYPSDTGSGVPNSAWSIGPQQAAKVVRNFIKNNEINFNI